MFVFISVLSSISGVVEEYLKFLSSMQGPGIVEDYLVFVKYFRSCL